FSGAFDGGALPISRVRLGGWPGLARNRSALPRPHGFHLGRNREWSLPLRRQRISPLRSRLWSRLECNPARHGEQRRHAMGRHIARRVALASWRKPFRDIRYFDGPSGPVFPEERSFRGAGWFRVGSDAERSRACVEERRELEDAIICEFRSRIN